MFRIETGRDVLHPLEASDEQRGANEQHDRERDLAGDEHALHTLASSDAAAAAAREGISAVAACRLQRRREREQQRRRDTARKRQNDEPQIEANIGNSRQFRRRGAECGDAPVRDEQTGGGADDREHDTFDEQLADDRPAMRAEHEPDRDLLLAPHRVGQHETRDVAAGGEQHERDGAEKEPQRSAHAADLLFLHRHESRSPSAIGLRKLLAETRLNAVEIRLRLVDRDARLHPAERRVESCRAYLQKTRRRPRGQPYLGALGRISKRSRHDADDRVEHAAEDQSAAGCRRVAVQPVAPERVAHDGDRRPSEAFFFGRRRPAERRSDAENREKSWRRAHRRHPFRQRAGRVGHVFEIHRRKPVEGVVARVPFFESSGCHELCRLAKRTVALVHRDKTIGARERQRLQQHGVDRREDGAVRADGESERQDDRRRQTRTASERTERGAHLWRWTDAAANGW